MRYLGTILLLSLAVAAGVPLFHRTRAGSRISGLLTNTGAAPAAKGEVLEPGWKLAGVQELPELVTSLMVAPTSIPEQKGLVFAGGTGAGGVYRFTPTGFGSAYLLSPGLGDSVQYGTCSVNRLEFHDLDGDGEPELLGSTSQVEPRGLPRLCVWSSRIATPVLRCSARPEISSSWSHSLAFLPRPGQPDSVFITFCGYGEVVEYRLGPGEGTDGFRRASLDWKQVGKVPASGEWIQAADADNDGRPEVCVATGYAENKAAVLLYDSPAAGAPLRQKAVLDEGHRFGNVRFIVAPLRPDGGQDVVAWWCTELAGGRAEMIRYRLGPEGVRERTVVATGSATDFWPDDGQFTQGDLDHDGYPEVWFATRGGTLWRYAPARDDRPVRVVRFDGPLGPVAVGPGFGSDALRLYIGQGRSVLALDPAPVPTKPRAKDANPGPTPTRVGPQPAIARGDGPALGGL